MEVSLSFGPARYHRCRSQAAKRRGSRRRRGAHCFTVWLPPVNWINRAAPAAAAPPAGATPHQSTPTAPAQRLRPDGPSRGGAEVDGLLEFTHRGAEAAFHAAFQATYARIDCALVLLNSLCNFALLVYHKSARGAKEYSLRGAGLFGAELVILGVHVWMVARRRETYARHRVVAVTIMRAARWVSAALGAFGCGRAFVSLVCWGARLLVVTNSIPSSPSLSHPPPPQRADRGPRLPRPLPSRLPRRRLAVQPCLWQHLAVDARAAAALVREWAALFVRLRSALGGGDS
jgi:hypothetical protein